MSGGGTFLDGAVLVSTLCLGAALLLTAIRIARGPTLPDRVLGLDLGTNLAVCFFALLALRPGSAAMVDVAFGVAVLGFLGTLAFSWFIERRNRS
jgi:multicomponent Na+:H+ antiporter subunit F